MFEARGTGSGEQPAGTCAESGAGTRAELGPGIERCADPGPDVPPSLVELLDGHRPGRELVVLLESIDLADANDPVLVEMVAAWDRLGSWVTARQARVVGELITRGRSSREREHVGDEISARLATTRAAASRMVELAEGAEALPAVGDALARGEVDARKAHVLLDEVAHLPRSAQRDVIEAVLPDAPGLTAPQLRNRVRRLEIATDPLGAQARHDRERTGRFVRLDHAADAMAWLTAYLPAVDAVAAFTAVDALARKTTEPGDARGVEARRADALVDVLRAVLDTGTGPTGPVPTGRGRRPHVQVTVASTTLLGLDDAPAELAGYGPVPAGVARALAAEGVRTSLCTEAITGRLVAVRGLRSASYRPSAELVATVVARDATCTFPGCRIPAWRCDIDHIEPFDPARPAQDQTIEENLHALCRHHHRLKTLGLWAVARDPVTGSTTWTAPSGNEYVRPPHRVDPAHLGSDRVDRVRAGPSQPAAGGAGASVTDRRGPAPPRR